MAAFQNGLMASLPAEFAQVMKCTRCTSSTDPYLLRDNGENVPQPGFVGANYAQKRVMFVGQNTGTPKSLIYEDLPYTAGLRALRDDPTVERYEKLAAILRDFMPLWRILDSFPLIECGLTLDDIAYCNIVRCRTTDDRAPRRGVSNNCAALHFDRWLGLLQPKVVVFLGWWPYERGSAFVHARGIAQDYINRSRSLSANDRAKNRERVAKLVLNYVGVSNL